MLRVIGGEFRSRKLQTLNSLDTRPTLDKTRGAIFSRIGPYFENETVLDLFAGSGALGIEAVSRGAKKAVFVDKNSNAIKVINGNIETLKIQDRTEVFFLDYERYLRECTEQFDYIFLDPPYDLDAYEKAVGLITERGLLKRRGRMILESRKEKRFILDDLPVTVEKEATYGISKITYLKLTEVSNESSSISREL